MKLINRLQILEARTAVKKPTKFHQIILADDGKAAEEAIEEFKAKNEVGPDDDFWIIRLVSPDPNRFRREDETK